MGFIINVQEIERMYENFNLLKDEIIYMGIDYKAYAQDNNERKSSEMRKQINSAKQELLSLAEQILEQIKMVKDISHKSEELKIGLKTDEKLISEIETKVQDYVNFNSMENA